MKRMTLILPLLLAQAAHAASVSLQLEAGAAISAQTEDLYVDERLPHDTQFTSPAFGVAVRVDQGPVQLSLGWRDLGHQYIDNARITLPDGTYFHCYYGTSPKGLGPLNDPCKPFETWNSAGSESQFYAELGYAFRLPGGWRIVPSLGLTETRVRWSTEVQIDNRPGWREYLVSQPETHPGALAGLSLQRGRFGVGAYYLAINPTRNADVDTYYPGQGESSVYVRATYRIGGKP